MLKHNDSATELLTILQEECAEVIQEPLEDKRFGQTSENTDRLERSGRSCLYDRTSSRVGSRFI